MSGELEQTSSDVSESSSSESSSSVSDDNRESKASSREENTPFHEHPRWKELIEQKNQFASQAEEFKRQISEMNKRFEEMNKPQNTAPKIDEQKLLGRLKDIDPEFGQYMEMLQNQLKESQTWRQNAEMNQVQSQAATQLQSLHKEHKVPNELQELYQARIKEIAQSNPNLGLKDLPNVYRQVHDQMNKFLDGYKRQQISEYTKSKKTDSSVPATTQRGNNAPKASGKKFEYSKDPMEARSQMVKRIISQIRDSDN